MTFQRGESANRVFDFDSFAVVSGSILSFAVSRMEFIRQSAVSTKQNWTIQKKFYEVKKSQL
jgi:hypothetical protein